MWGCKVASHANGVLAMTSSGRRRQPLSICPTVQLSIYFLTDTTLPRSTTSRWLR